MSKQKDPPGRLVYALGDRLYINLTSGCSLKCQFCLKNNDTGPMVGDVDLSLGRQPSATEIRKALTDLEGYAEVVFCGFGEPTLRLPTLLELAEFLKRKNMPVRLNTDGLANRVFRRDVTPQFAGRIDRISVSLNAQDAETYNRLCAPPWPDAFQYLMDFIRNARDHVEEVSATAIDGLEGVDIEACRRLAEEDLGVMFRPRPLDDIG
ncbi:TatD family nuclease-associated radical SAM protein [Thiohalorhabdus methylotrophus]|uniref:TatD family nuclease-associated radical SAM protein n=1 Tax=Thiohalorhabdus methylotrophus TaxID=3242694 RepID=A0ABV4TX89_9GAMM